MWPVHGLLIRPAGTMTAARARTSDHAIHLALDLARWLVNKENPLTARVYVNRLWQQFFGTGLVKSSNDFGMQSDLPSHPALLEWLAASFRESGWDVRATVRLLVTSAAFRRSSAVTPAVLQADPENRLFWRATPRRR